ncbi:hypothetical protein [Nocardia sp. NPDC057227]|uniref:hypothetical protein n=1 Tax=Nocardia sp. NPDC057227 TaxID=3346056 RepID=UPI00363DFA83
MNLDIDDPDEVIAAATGFTTAIDTVGELVTLVTGELEPPRRPGSALDRVLADRLGWIVDTFDGALRNDAGRTALTLRQITETARALGAADIAGGQATRWTGAG